MDVRVQLYKVCCAVLVLKNSTRKILQPVLDIFASIFEFARPLFSTFHQIYLYVDRLEDRTWTSVPEGVLDEIRGAALMLPFSFTDIRAESPVVLASDATPTHGGVASAPIDLRLAKALFRISEDRRCNPRIDGGRCLESSLKLKERSEVTNQVTMSLDWRETAVYPINNIQHINIQEAKTILNEVKRLASVSNGRPRGAVNFL